MVACGSQPDGGLSRRHDASRERVFVPNFVVARGEVDVIEVLRDSGFEAGVFVRDTPFPLRYIRELRVYGIRVERISRRTERLPPAYAVISLDGEVSREQTSRLSGAVVMRWMAQSHVAPLARFRVIVIDASTCSDAAVVMGQDVLRDSTIPSIVYVLNAALGRDCEDLGPGVACARAEAAHRWDERYGSRHAGVCTGIFLNDAASRMWRLRNWSWGSLSDEDQQHSVDGYWIQLYYPLHRVSGSE